MTGRNTAGGGSTWTSDLRVIWHLIARPVKGRTHAERLESFYSGQAEDYDAFRSRLLHGRHELIDRLVFPTGGVWVDLGAGTGENVLRAGQRTAGLNEIVLVDLSPSLLQLAERQLKQAAMRNARCCLADVTQLELPSESVDLVTFSYSLTMIPDWFAAIDNAFRILRPGGTIAATDFYVSRKFAPEDQRQHGWCCRSFWTHWFAADHVCLNADHLAMLRRRFRTERLDERYGKVPYLPLARAPYYVFIGTKPGTPGATDSEAQAGAE
jgi:S-adenosylmethionine-diacylgycerolhomoserine-N-methlytransferase